jgi:uncharacterized protein YndB with AHSA1/START domain
MDVTGRLEPTGSTVTVRHERAIDADPAEVWRALTEPSLLEQWLAPTKLDGRVGGAIVVTWPDDQGEMRGTIRVLDEPSVLECTWSEGRDESMLRFELEPREGGSDLRLIHSGTSRTDAPGFGAGWQSHLEALDDVLDGRESASADRDARYRELRPGYEALLERSKLSPGRSG